MSQLSFVCFCSDLCILASNKRMHKVLDEFEFQSDGTSDD